MGEVSKESFLILYQSEILAGLFIILSVLLGAFYSSSKNWKQQKYFKLQEISEEIIIALWNYNKISDEIYISELVDEQCENMKKLQDQYHDIVFSKIQVYFSEFGLTDVRDLSVKLSNLITDEYLEGRKLGNIDSDKLNDIREEINNNSVKLKELLIIKVKRYGRPWYKNFIYYRIEKYN